MGELVRGYVKAISARGCFVSLSRAVDGFVGLRHIADDYIDANDLPKLLPVGTLVVGRALPRGGAKGGGGGGGALPMSLKRSEVEGGVYVKPPITLRYEDVTPGMVLDGAIKSVQDFGVFVRLDGSEVDALCHSSEVSDKRVGSLKAAFKPGERVKVVVLRKNEEKGQLSASMKRSRLEEFGWDEDEEAEAKAKAGKAEGADVDEEEEDDEEDEEDDEDDDEMDDDEMDDDEMDDDDDDEEEDEEDEEEDDDDGSLIEEDEDEDMLDDDDDDDEEEETRRRRTTTTTTMARSTRATLLAAIAASGGGSRAKLGELTGGPVGGGFTWSDFEAGHGGSAGAGAPVRPLRTPAGRRRAGRRSARARRRRSASRKTL